MDKELNKRIAWLDTVRVIAILMVVFMHSPIPNPENPLKSSYLLGGLSYLTFPCIGLFFMASGTLLFPVKMTITDFLKKRFSRILFPTIFWSLFYIAVKYFYHETDLTGAGKLILKIPFTSVEGVLWFMYTLTGLYLFAPIISKWLETSTKKEIQYFLVLWLIVMCFPYFSAFIDMREGDYRLLSTFSGFMGYMVMGYYLRKFPIDLNSLANKTIVGAGILILSIILPSIFYLVPINGFDPGTVLYNYLSVSIVAMSIGWFLLIRNLKSIHANRIYSSVIGELSVMSFGIYLIHIFIMRRLIWNLMPIGTLPLWLEIVVVAIATFALSYLIVKIISKLPLGKYLIG